MHASWQAAKGFSAADLCSLRQACNDQSAFLLLLLLLQVCKCRNPLLLHPNASDVNGINASQRISMKFSCGGEWQQECPL
jgi:hypothetical protein